MKFLKDLLFLRRVGCGAIGSFVCEGVEKLYSRKQRCFYCKAPSLYGPTHPGAKKFGVDGIISIYYNPFLRNF